MSLRLNAWNRNIFRSARNFTTAAAGQNAPYREVLR